MKWLKNLFVSNVDVEAINNEGRNYARTVKIACARKDIDATERACSDLFHYLEWKEPTVTAPKARQLIGFLYHDIGADCRGVGLREFAERAYHRAISVLLSIRGNSKLARSQIAACNNQLGLIFFETAQRERAVPFFDKAIEIRRELSTSYPDDAENKIYLAGALCNHGHVSRELGQNSSAHSFYEQSLELIEKTIPTCDCGCRDMLAEMISHSTNHPHWIFTAHQFRRNVELGLSYLQKQKSPDKKSEQNEAP